MTEHFAPVMVPAEHVPFVNTLGRTALFNIVPELPTTVSDLVTEVAGVYRTRTQYQFDLKISSPAISDNVSITVDKDKIETSALALLETFPTRKW